jgi:hypothetical protein
MTPPLIPIEDYLTQQASKMDFIFREFANGKIGIRQWRDEMAAYIRETHIRASVIARDGTRSPLLQRVQLWAQREQKIRQQTRYLNKWVRQIENGELSAESLLGQLRARARLYANNARDTWENTRQTVMKAIGRTEKRRVLGPLSPNGKHCPDCERQAGFGWVPIDDPSVTGTADWSTACGPGCTCTIEYR